MSEARDVIAARRLEVLNTLRERRGTERHAGAEEPESSRFWPFLESQTIADDGASSQFLPPSPDQMRIFQGKIRDLRAHSQEHPLAATSTDQPAGPRRWELLAEIASDHFRRNMGQWMGGIPTVPDVCSTPVEEMEQLLVEASHRRKMLQAMLRMATHEIEVLENQITLKRKSLEP